MNRSTTVATHRAHPRFNHRGSLWSLCCILLVGCSQVTDKQPGKVPPAAPLEQRVSPEEMIEAARQAVRPHLEGNQEATFPNAMDDYEIRDEGTDRFRIKSFVELEQEPGSFERETWQVVLHHSNGDYQVIGLVIGDREIDRAAATEENE